MNQIKTIKFQGEEYFDDRLFVLYLCKGKVEIQSDGVIITTIYHEQEPADFIWEGRNGVRNLFIIKK